jgi:hypothetical protein
MIREPAEGNLGGRLPVRPPNPSERRDERCGGPDVRGLEESILRPDGVRRSIPDTVGAREETLCDRIPCEDREALSTGVRQEARLRLAMQKAVLDLIGKDVRPREARPGLLEVPNDEVANPDVPMSPRRSRRSSAFIVSARGVRDHGFGQCTW